MRTWEYMLMGETRASAVLDAYGRQGWELVSIYGEAFDIVFVFKRETTSNPESAGPR